MKVTLVKTVVWGLLTFLIAMPLGSATCEGAPKGLKAILEETSAVSADVSLLNLINGLNLDSSQLKRLAGLNRRAGEIRNSAVEKARPLSDRFVVAMEKLKSALIDESNQSETLGQEAAGLKHELKEIAGECIAEVANLADQAEKILSDTQRMVMENFKPCIIPPRNFKDPVRVGQAASSAVKEKILKKVRQMPEKQYMTRKEKLIDRFIVRSEKRLGSLSNDEKSTLRKRAIEMTDRVRAMEDADFQADLGKLAEELKPPQAEEMDLLDDLRKKVRSRKPHPGAMTKWFLVPTALPILESKAARLDRFR